MNLKTAYFTDNSIEKLKQNPSNPLFKKINAYFIAFVMQ